MIIKPKLCLKAYVYVYTYVWESNKRCSITEYLLASMIMKLTPSLKAYVYKYNCMQVIQTIIHDREFASTYDYQAESLSEGLWLYAYMYEYMYASPTNDVPWQSVY